ncbi:DUF6992 family protein [Hymenobacter swuensis]|uniref:Uncharacterized protein n=1 Tax=Hymenobacter swuensis DY53 TaxID=1227739 RepID=W8FCQ0_9BACT|nr:hypothetical protein [Hymenobacter swuensis]AHJ99435.1 hypothetical protein Hsw_3840 [Hymenobacter swuensis DY53]
MPATPALNLINHARELLAERGMAVLGAWALLNLVVSGYHVARTDARTAPHHFHLMNVAWNVVNTLIAVWGLLQAHPQQVVGLTLPESLAAQSHFENVLLLNAGLDVGYLAIGRWLQSRAATAERPERMVGYGHSVLLQGGFLLLFDLSFYLVYHRYAAQLLALGI